MNRLNLVIILTQLTGLVFAAFAFGITILFSTVGGSGGSLLAVLNANPVLRLPLSIVGGLFIILILTSLAWYARVKWGTRAH
jgi:hypothetical protein